MLVWTVNFGSECFCIAITLKTQLETKWKAAKTEMTLKLQTTRIEP